MFRVRKAGAGEWHGEKCWTSLNLEWDETDGHRSEIGGD